MQCPLSQVKSSVKVQVERVSLLVLALLSQFSFSLSCWTHSLRPAGPVTYSWRLSRWTPLDSKSLQTPSCSSSQSLL